MRCTPRALAPTLLVLALSIVAACGDDGPANTTPDAPEVDAPPDAPPLTEVTCAPLPPVTTGTCQVTPGGATKLLQGEILTPTKLFHAGQVAVDAQGSITCVGCDCAQGGETIISCPDASISPGLINTHDHITFTQNAPYTENPAIRYDHRHQWRKGQDGKPKIPAAGGASADQIRWGELRFLMGGATSIVGSGGQTGLLRNLDSAQQEGLAQRAVNFDTFPLDDSGGTRRTADCNYGGSAATASSIASDDSYEPHTSEGVDQSARNEFLCQSDPTYDTSTPGVANDITLGKTAMIHAVGLQPADFGKMAAAGTALIWSPRSNITLYGETARVSTAAAMGVEIALGTDWMPTGSMNLLRELACADSFNKNYLGSYFTDVALWKMVTSSAAAVTATDDVIGLLAPGKIADIAIFRRAGRAPYRAVIEAEPKDVALVMRGGKVLYGDGVAVAALATGTCDVVDVCGESKRVCLTSEIGKSYTALQTAAGTSIYPAFQCGVPMKEPTCVPSRPTATNSSTVFTGAPTAEDADGDGLPNTADNCPMVFNPVRPLDNGMQGDADADSQGDACDPCPLDANTTQCTVVNPNDRDGDGYSNDADNCPDAANATQTDSDVDGKGDVCDACPNQANPGAGGCAVSIYAIKDGTVALGAQVTVTNALVTGKGTNGFFVQVKEGDPAYVSADNSGLFVFTGTAAPTLASATVGARVTVSGKVTSFQGQIELDTVTAVTVTAAGPEALPTPIAATYAEVKTGGPRALTLESVIVTLGPASVTAVNASFGEVTLTDSGNNQLIVDDFLFVLTPTPPVGKAYSIVRGILTLRQSVSKIEPRSAADLVAGAPALASLTPALTYARVGATTGAPTFPTPLTVTLSAPAQGNTTVTLMSGATGQLTTMTTVVIPDGQTSVVVPVTAVAANGASPEVTVMATLGTQVRMAQVRVLGSTETGTVVNLTPAGVAVSAGGSAQMTVNLDVPALADTVVALALAPTTAGSLPMSVTVLAGALGATVTYVDGSSVGTATITATLGASSSNAMVTVSAGSHLVINEIDYDQVGSDTAEFVEIYNPTSAAINLAGTQLLLVNGSGSIVYDTVDLTGTLAAGGYLVLAGANVTVTAPATKLDPGWIDTFVQNGAPDGILLIDATSSTIIDAIAYEGDIADITPPGFAAPVSLIGTSTTVADSNTVVASLCRSPNGQDTDTSSADWKVCSVVTPGTANP